MRSRNAPLINDLVDSKEKEEQKGEDPQTLINQVEAVDPRGPRNSTILHSSRRNRGSIGDTDFGLTLNRDNLPTRLEDTHREVTNRCNDPDDGNFSTAQDAKDDCVLVKRSTSMGKDRQHLYIRNKAVDTDDSSKKQTSQPQSLSLKRAWENEEIKENLYDEGRLRRAQEESKKYYFDSKPIISRKPKMTFKLPKISSQVQPKMINGNVNEHEFIKNKSEQSPLANKSDKIEETKGIDEEIKEFEEDINQFGDDVDVMDLMPLNNNSATKSQNLLFKQQSNNVDTEQVEVLSKDFTSEKPEVEQEPMQKLTNRHYSQAGLLSIADAQKIMVLEEKHQMSAQELIEEEFENLL